MYNVDGFLFEDEAMAELARKEEEGVKYIRERTAMDNPEVVLQLYTKLINQELFVTPVGIRFLAELQNILLASTHIPKENIPPIKVTPYTVPEPKPKQLAKQAAKNMDTKAGRNYKKPFYAAMFFAIVFGISIMGMFVITEISGNNVNIINYRNEILNEYSSWEEELQEKEDALKAWEKELQERESGL